jgi:uncharacterized protein YndB with AHSA1/START domain
MTPGEGMSVPRAETDAKIGGRFTIIMVDGEKEIPHAGTYKVIDPYSRIMFTWESPHSADGSIVTLNFTPVGTGATDVELVQVKFSNEQSRDGHTKDWTAILASLDRVLACID